MANKDRGAGGGENRWPLGFDHHDPEGWAAFSLHLGYEQDDIVRTLVARHNLDQITARQIVQEVARTDQTGGGTR